MKNRTKKLLKQLLLLVLIAAMMPVYSMTAFAMKQEEKPVLDESIEREICEAFLTYLEHNQIGYIVKEYELDELQVEEYYGEYSGYHIVQMGFTDWVVTSDMAYVTIAEYEFAFGSSCYPPYFLAYKDGTFICVKDAYTSGMLTDRDIYLIAKNAEELIVSWKDPFLDVAKGDWYYKSVEGVYAYNLFAGLTETTFGPDEEMTRAMLAAVLWRYAGSPDGSQNVFTDVPEDTWYTDAVAWAAEQGLVYGISDGIYAPEEKITREQMAAIFYRYAKKVNAQDLEADGEISQYADAEEISHWAYESVSWANGRGILSGRDIDGVMKKWSYDKGMS